MLTHTHCRLATCALKNSTDMYGRPTSMLIKVLVWFWAFLTKDLHLPRAETQKTFESWLMVWSAAWMVLVLTELLIWHGSHWTNSIDWIRPSVCSRGMSHIWKSICFVTHFKMLTLVDQPNLALNSDWDSAEPPIDWVCPRRFCTGHLESVCLLVTHFMNTLNPGVRLAACFDIEIWRWKPINSPTWAKPGSAWQRFLRRVRVLFKGLCKPLLVLSFDWEWMCWNGIDLVCPQNSL